MSTTLVSRLIPVLLVVAALVPTSAAAAPVAGSLCGGDCDGNGEVAINELITGVGIALGSAGAATCVAMDTNANTEVAVNELVAAVGHALDGCPARVPGVETVAGVVLSVTRGAAGLSSALLATVAAVNASAERTRLASAEETGGPAADPCPLGGTNERLCENVNPLTIRQRFFWDECGVARPVGSLILDGEITLTAPGICPGTILPVGIATTIDLLVALADPDGGMRRARIVAAGTLDSVTLGERPCPIKGGEATLTGTVTSDRPGDPASTMELQSTQFSIEFRDFAGNCEPATATMVLDGPLVIADRQAEPPVDIALTAQALRVVQRLGDAAEGTAELDGRLDADCFGGAVTLDTSTPLAASLGTACPVAGAVGVSAGSGAATIFFGESAPGDAGDQAVVIDNGLDGQPDATYGSCVDPALRTCGG